MINKIRKLELVHKQSRAPETYLELTQTRKVLLEIFDRRTCRKFTLNQKLFYEQSNKCGRLLARAIQTKRASTNVHTIKDSLGKSSSVTADIASQFERYYTKVYNNLPFQPKATTGHNPRKALIKDFLKKFSPKPISREDACEEDNPISEEELKIAIKQLKMGKRPGADSFSASYFKIFADTLTALFLKAFNSLTSSTLPFHRLLEAHISYTERGEGHHVSYQL